MERFDNEPDERFIQWKKEMLGEVEVEPKEGEEEEEEEKREKKKKKSVVKKMKEWVKQKVERVLKRVKK